MIIIFQYISNIFTAFRLRCVLHCFALHLPVRLTCCTSQPIAELIFWADMSSALWYRSCRWRPLHLPHEVPNHAAFRSVYPQLVATLQDIAGYTWMWNASSCIIAWLAIAWAGWCFWTLLDIAGHVVTYVTRITKLSLGVAQDKDDLVTTRSTTICNVYHLVNVFNPSEKY